MKKTGYGNIDFQGMTLPSGISRRNFLKRLGGGLTIAVVLSDVAMLYGDPLAEEVPTDWNAYVRINENGTVTLMVGKIEMGQGVITSLAQMMAEELDVSLDSVSMIMGDTDLCPYDAGTWGSLSTRTFGPILRAASAQGRAILLAMASEHLKVPADRLTVVDGVVVDKNNKKKRVSYADLAAGKQIVRTLTELPPLKKPSEFKIIGKSVSRRDAVEKVTGAARYAGDIRLEGLLYAKVLRPPALDATLVSVDLSEAEQVDGLEIVKDGDFVAVLHQDYETAEAGLQKIKAEFTEPEVKVNDTSIFEYLVEMGTEAQEVETHGNPEKGIELSKKVEESTFLDGYVAHAPIETHTATAVMDGDIMKIWASSQTPFGARKQVSNALGIPLEKVHMQEVFIGGGFGGKIAGPQVVEAARIAKLSGKPVQLIWTRWEEFFYDTFRPAAVVKIKSGVDDSGLMKLWEYDVYFAGARGSTLFYDFPDSKVVHRHSGKNQAHPLGTGAWRAPGNNTNTFARESQMDIMAIKSGLDPLEFRLRNLKDQKMIRVLKAAAEKFGWTPAGNQPSGRGYGIACGIDAGTYVATMAEVKVDSTTGEVEVVRVVAAQDMGLVINPLGANMQVESCVTMGLGYCLTEDIQFEGGKVLNRNFDKYELPRFSWVPQIDSVLIEAPEDPPQGGGEPVIVCMGGLIANAIFDAVGARVYQLPITPERILAAMG